MMNRNQFKTWLGVPAIGMVHLRPLPGSPRWGGDMSGVQAAALLDARTLASAGFATIMVENFHDVPFYRDAVPPVTVAAMTRILGELRRELPDLRIGINVLRNDALAALAIAAAVEGAMIRVNVLTGAVVTDQGLIQGDAAKVMRARQQLCPDVKVLADLRVKHGAPLSARGLAEEARDLRLRAAADALIISGTGTGAAADADEAAELRSILPDCPILVGSGMSIANLSEFSGIVDGYIVGSSLQTLGPDGWPAIDPQKANTFIQAVRAAHIGSGEGENS
jgi:uncharacterized protein